FILGTLFRLSGSLWLCVLYHALLNAFSQTVPGCTMKQTAITAGINILLAVILVRCKNYKSIRP
ncbi:MAG: hypothetical protein ACRCUT_00915, partial [Spirochaetota bacterium]